MSAPARSNSDRLWSLAETAAYLGITRDTLYHWVAIGKAPRSIKVGRYRKFKQADIDAYEAANASDVA